jgi:hypothetical protein
LTFFYQRTILYYSDQHREKTKIGKISVFLLLFFLFFSKYIFKK